MKRKVTKAGKYSSGNSSGRVQRVFWELKGHQVPLASTRRPLSKVTGLLEVSRWMASTSGSRSASPCQKPIGAWAGLRFSGSRELSSAGSGRGSPRGQIGWEV